MHSLILIDAAVAMFFNFNFAVSHVLVTTNSYNLVFCLVHLSYGHQCVGINSINGYYIFITVVR